MKTMEIYVAFDGTVKVLEGMRVIRNDSRKEFIHLGAGAFGRRMGFDKNYPPEVLDVSHPSEKYQNFRCFSVAIKTVTPRVKGGESFTVLAALKPGEKDGDEILLRVTIKHSKTAQLIFDLDYSETMEVLAAGAVVDMNSNGEITDSYPDFLLVLGKGESISFYTKGGDWRLTNIGAGDTLLVKASSKKQLAGKLEAEIKKVASDLPSSKDRKSPKPAKGDKPKRVKHVAWPLKPPSTSSVEMVVPDAGNDDSALAQALIRELVKPATIKSEPAPEPAPAPTPAPTPAPAPAPAPEPTSDEVMMAFFGMPSSNWETSVVIGL